MELLSRLRRAVRKLTFLLNLKTFINQSSWRFASLMARARAPAARLTGRRWRARALSFNDRPGLRELGHSNHDDDHDDHDHDGDDDGDDDVSVGPASPGAVLRRTMSSPVAAMDDDVDERAERFIAWFREQLSYERQISLDLRYVNRGYSFQGSTTSSNDSNLVSPLFSPT